MWQWVARGNIQIRNSRNGGALARTLLRCCTICTRVLWTHEPMHESAARSVGVQFYVSLSSPLFVGSFVAHFDNMVVPYRQHLKLHFRNTIVPYQLPLRLTLRNVAVRLPRNYTCIFRFFTMRMLLFGTIYGTTYKYIHTNIHTYIHTDIACIQHINVGFVQAHPN